MNEAHSWKATGTTVGKLHETCCACSVPARNAAITHACVTVHHVAADVNWSLAAQVMGNLQAFHDEWHLVLEGLEYPAMQSERGPDSAVFSFAGTCGSMRLRELSIYSFLDCFQCPQCACWMLLTNAQFHLHQPLEAFHTSLSRWIKS